MMGIKIADKLSGSGKEVFGWDSEWKMNFTSHQKYYGARRAFKKLLIKQTKLPSKIVILSHDIAYMTRFDDKLITHLTYLTHITHLSYLTHLTCLKKLSFLPCLTQVSPT
jgi:hypothetical protein